MSDQWKEIIGDFKTISSNAMKNILGRSMYLTILKHKDNLNEESNKDIDQFYMYETLHMALNPKKKEETKYTYKGDKTTIDRKTKEKKVEKNVDLPMKKFANITGEVKNGLTFLLNKYINECYLCYIDGKRTFPDESQVLSHICNYSESQCSQPIAPIIIKSVDVLDVEELVEGNYANCLKQLVEKLRAYFKDKEDKVPEKQLGTLVDAFIKFMKIIAIYMTDILFEKRQAVNGVFLFGILRQLNSSLKQHGVRMDSELFDNLREYIEINKPKKESTGKGKKKKSDDEDEDNDEENEEEEEEEVEKKPKKGRGRPKSTKKKETSSKKHDSDNEDEALDVDDEVDKLDDDDWNDEANYDE